MINPRFKRSAYHLPRLRRFCVPMKNSNPIFQAHFQHLVAQAKKIVLEAGYHERILIVGDGKQQVIIELSMSAPTPQARLKAMFQAGVQLAQQRNVETIEELFFIAEARAAVPNKRRPSLTPHQPLIWKDVLLI